MKILISVDVRFRAASSIEFSASRVQPIHCLSVCRGYLIKLADSYEGTPRRVSRIRMHRSHPLAAEPSRSSNEA